MSASQFIFEATEENFQQGVIENSHRVPVVVDFWAEWCQPCKQLIPILEKLVDEMQGQFVLAKVNSETQLGLSQQFNVRSIPSVFILKEGEIVEHFTGLQTEERIKELVSRHITTEADRLRAQAREIIQGGDFDSGKRLLLDAEQMEPEKVTIQIDLAHIEAMEKAYDAARQRLKKLKIIDQDRPEVVSLLSKIELEQATQDAPSQQELEARLDKTPEDNLARFQLATQLIAQGAHEAGLNHLLTLLQRDRNFHDGIAQKTMISTFNLLGDEHPLVGQYRRKLFNALH